MKKLIAIILAAILLFATPVLAEGIDLSTMTIDELVVLRTRINAEINGRMSGSDNAFPPFDYKVGKHIPAGVYMITCAEILNGEYEGRAAAWAEGESNWNCHTILYFESAGEFGLIELSEGDTLRFLDCYAIITPYILPTI